MRGIGPLLLALWLSPSATGGQDRPAAADFPVFANVAETLGVTLENVAGGVPKDYIVQSLGNGAAFLDHDGDGDVDLLIVNGSTMEDYSGGGHPMAALYENDGERFRDVTADAGIDARGWGVGVCAADYDNDGRTDVYLTAYGANVLYRNDAGSAFTDVTGTAGVGDPRWSTNCAFGDYDRDGHVDLYVANYVEFDPETIPRRGEIERCRYMGAPVFCGPLDLPGARDTLYRNNGDGTFTDVTAEAGVGDGLLYGLGTVFGDFDNDGWPDIYVANYMSPTTPCRTSCSGTTGTGPSWRQA